MPSTGTASRTSLSHLSDERLSGLRIFMDERKRRYTNVNVLKASKRQKKRIRRRLHRNIRRQIKEGAMINDTKMENYQGRIYEQFKKAIRRKY